MLKKLIVKNFAIIEDIEVDFKTGMTSLTGETGAGKSLIIDSIGLLLGNRASKEMIRYGSTDALIVGEFSNPNIRVLEALKKIGIDILPTLTISRRISSKNRGKIEVNGNQINLQLLKEITFNLADIHVQHDTYKLIDRENYLSFIDDFNNNDFLDLFNNYQEKLNDYQQKYKDYSNIIHKQKETLDKLEFLEFERKELESLNLTIDIDSITESEINKLKNFDKLYNDLHTVYNNFSLEEHDLLDYLSQNSKILNDLEFIDPKYKEMASKLENSYFESLDIKDKIRFDIENLDFDPDYLDLLENRLHDINSLKLKYNKSVKELMDYLIEITLEIDLVKNYDSVINEYKNILATSYNDLVSCSKKLTLFRKKQAKSIEENLVKILTDLDLPDSKFIVHFEPVIYNNYMNNASFSNQGADKIDFLIGLNKGEPVKSLAKTSSGGEMSRIMLAFKTYFSKKSNLDLIVFDEIDSGISGSTAIEVAKKLKDISKYMQVLCITHLPQVAAYGDNHYYIYKVISNDRTYTKIEYLDNKGRITALAKMLSGKVISNIAIEHSKELLKKSI